MYEENSVIVAEYIPFKNFKDRMQIMKVIQCPYKDIEVWEEGLYVCEKGWGSCS